MLAVPATSLLLLVQSMLHMMCMIILGSVPFCGIYYIQTI
jgi:hypothetical protein